MSKIKIISICLFIIFICAFVFINQIRAELVTLIFSTAFSRSHIMQVKVFEPWADKLNILTKGKASIKFFPEAFMGPISKQYILVEQGITDISYSLQNNVPGRFPMTGVFELPFMIPTAERTSKVMWQVYDKFPDFRREYNKVELLALFCPPGDHFHTLSKPIENISDFKGLRIITTNPFAADALRILGASPVTLVLDESYSALEKGSADGILIHWEGLVDFKLDNLIKYTTEVYFCTSAMMVAISRVKFSSLSRDIQRVIEKTSGLEFSTLAGRTYDSMEENYRETALKKGIKVYKFSDSDMKKLQSLTIPLREQWLKNMRDRGLSGERVLQDVLLLEAISKLRYY